MNSATATSLAQYLQQIRAALRGADPALIQDALYDAEEYVRAEMAEHPELDETQIVMQVAGSYGSPEEIADIYRDTEVTVTRALRTPTRPPAKSVFARFFGVAVEGRTYAALLYMLLSLATGILYFTVTVTGVSLSFGLAILIIGIPVVILVAAILRVLSLLEGRIVETMLGVRMPRRPLYPKSDLPILERIKAMFTDPRTWSTILYNLLMLPLGIAYFTIAVTGLSLSLGLIVTPIASFFIETLNITLDGERIHSAGVIWNGVEVVPAIVVLPLAFIAGLILLFTLMHLARGIGHLHGQLAKNLLVKSDF